MIKYENDEELDDEACELIEEMLEIHLRTVPVGQWFNLADLSRSLGIKLSTKNEGPAERLVQRVLKNWNWHARTGFYEQTNYVRKCYTGPLATIRLLDGTKFLSEDTWPRYGSEEADRSRGNAFEKAVMRRRQRNRTRKARRDIQSCKSETV